MIVKLFTGPLNYDLSQYQKEESELLIGVDQGCEFLMNHQLPIDLAIGDFDSINVDKDMIKKYAKRMIEHSSIKDYTDTHLALEEALKLNADKIVIYGGLGGRVDHTYANMQLLRKGSIELITNDTKMYSLSKGKHNIKNDFKYISFFALEPVKNLVLNGFKYEVKIETLEIDNPLCISNQGSGSVSFTDGMLLVIYSNEN